MYLSQELIQKAIEEIKSIHSFYGIDFLAAKSAGLPIGQTISVSMDSVVREHMDKYFKPFAQSERYYRYYKPPKNNKWWTAKYPGSGSQSSRTRGHFSEAFIHDTKNQPRLWGWQPNYLDVLESQLPKSQKIPVFYLAVWLFRQHEWAQSAMESDIVQKFISEFNISHEELERLFDASIPSTIGDMVIFSEEPISAQTLIPQIGIPPDLPEEGGGILSYLQLQHVGPSQSLTFEPGKRLNLITGDNGLGKTFLLDTSWWALTGEWIDYPADPVDQASQNPLITYRISGEYTESSLISVKYDRETFSWPIPTDSQAIPSLLVYAQADNSFAVWDPAPRSRTGITRNNSALHLFKFSPEDVWFGLEDRESRRSISEGLLRDWVTWQRTRADEFNILTRVMKHLSPNDLGEFEPGQPIRVANESRMIPTLSLPYGDVAIIYTSEGMKRVISLAYLLVWAWNEHKIYSEQAGQEPQRRMVIIIDEIEAHLHPKWQRVILPALMSVQAELSKQLEVQFLVATHSPLVMASAEPVFDTDTDKIFNLDLVDQNFFQQKVILKEVPFVRYGVVDSWLTSDVFELSQPRNSLAESAVEDAKRIQLQDEPDQKVIREIHERLVQYLAADDDFWPRWLFFAEQNGVEV